MVARRAIGIQTPRIRSVPRSRKSRGREAIEVSKRAGLLLDEWQQDVIMDACKVRANGRWAASEVGLDVARQNGKGGILEARELGGIFAFDERLIIHSAHEFATATEAFLRMEALLEEGEFQKELKPKGGINRSHGHEGFTFKSGQRLKYRTRTGGGGRGFTCDCLVLDEAMILKEAFIGALFPTQSGRSMVGNPQVWYTGSAVDQLIHEHGTVFARLRERGHKGGDPSLAWFEWSAEFLDETGEPIPLIQLDEELLSDLSAWKQANPGLGIRISPEWVENELRSMAARTFAVERLGIGDWPSGEEGTGSIIDIQAWDALVEPHSVIRNPVAIAFDVTPDRAATSICAAGARSDGLAHVELIEHARGTGWVVNELVRLNARHKPSAVFCDASGPAASIVHELGERGVIVETVSAPEHAQACGQLFDSVQQEKLRHLGQPELRAAIKGAARRPLGDAWAWSRKTSAVDISPLVGCTLAYWGWQTGQNGKPFAFAW